MTQLAKDCIASWHKYMPDWEFKLWNEDNFDVNYNAYTKEAYEAKKYAFVTDVVRLYALYTEGGVYMDTDVEVLKPYDDLLSLSGFTGYEGSKRLPPVTGTIAATAGNKWVEEQLKAYESAHFRNADGSFDLTTNTMRISKIMQDGGFASNGEKQIYKDMHIFPVEYFCPRQTTGEFLLTENTYCDHLFLSSWDVSHNNKTLLAKILGPQLIMRLIKIKRKIVRK